jgi:DNA-binding GntR family transcriptional regulator
VLQAADSDRLTSMVHEVVALPLVYRSYVWYSTAQTRASYAFHRQLVAAFADRDAATAEHVMRRHVFAAREVLVDHLDDIQHGENGR